MLTFIKIMGLTAVAGGMTVWWWMVAGMLNGRVEAPSQGAATVWFSIGDSPTAFWVTIGAHLIVGLFFNYVGYSILRKEKV